MNETLTCYLLDDESPAHIIFSKYIGRVPYLTLLGHNTDPFDGLEQVKALRPDILFLDVEMPDMNGIEFLKSLPQPHPVVIMVTGSPQFAADTYNFESVTHYLAKPVGFSKFMEAIDRATKRLGFQVNPDAPLPTRPPARNQTDPVTDIRETFSSFIVKVDKKLVTVVPENILYVEGMKDYLKIHLLDRMLVTHITMTRIEEMLPPSQFLRVHRSFIVRRQAIKEIDGNVITVTDGRKLDIGVTYRQRVMDDLNKNLLR